MNAWAPRLTRGVALVAMLATSSCGLVINGISSKVSAKSSTPGAKVYVNGFEATQKEVIVLNDRPSLLLVRAKGYRDRVITLEPHTPAGPIVLDVIFAVPSLLMAPLIDLQAGMFSSISGPDDPVALEADSKVTRPRPTYSLK